MSTHTRKSSITLLAVISFNTCWPHQPCRSLSSWTARCTGWTCSENHITLKLFTFSNLYNTSVVIESAAMNKLYIDKFMCVYLEVLVRHPFHVRQSSLQNSSNMSQTIIIVFMLYISAYLCHRSCPWDLEVLEYLVVRFLQSFLRAPAVHDHLAVRAVQMDLQR